MTTELTEKDQEQIDVTQKIVDALLVNLFAACMGRPISVGAGNVVRKQFAIEAFDQAEFMLAESKRRGYADVKPFFDMIEVAS